MFQIKFNNQFHVISNHPADNTLYCLNDIHKASGGEERDEPNYFTRQFSSPKMGFIMVKGRGKKQGTYAPKKTCYKYANWISNKRADDDEFYDAVFECFEAASEGRTMDAMTIASTVAITPELIAKEKKLYSEMVSLIQHIYPQPQWAKAKRLPNIRIKHYADLANLISTGYTSKTLTGGLGSVMSHIQKLDHEPCLGARVATLTLIINLLQQVKINPALKDVVDYQFIKTTLSLPAAD